ncbi:methylmalonyl-CoA epimerase [Gordonia terrae]|uniref:Methylmalonyl-CoA epimerase n=2 Tax=Gordonia terrae TaxID=2055 RepID=A0A2I1R1L2_9ACTN|nr:MULTISPECIES: methylmalonyl-CoA epimerase [Gordonia]VTR10002.1 4-hydroxyphenylpyruvate dioxygenase [Clostridioides difficile]ANY23104.1 methylmalonyl-CoA epimerase [Gordonia terrae]AWO83833.1 methylmalonyl-CoA epimerase [Gordonia terrae]PKZ63012.1 methylmalonyl-CoA epimerase [Gordonia terrae]VTS48024.1 4-hydroxyphenylpyruvate dioxygenase and related hemolysins [Gordonia terrae]
MSSSATDPSTTALISDLIIAIDHVGIAVPDLEAAKEWYATHLGFETLHQETNAEQGVEEAMVGPAGGTGAVIQLLAPLDESSTIAKFIDRNGPGLQQLAVRVTDVDAVTARLTEAGVRVLYPAAKRGTADSRINFVHPKDAGGVLLELVEPAATAH